MTEASSGLDKLQDLDRSVFTTLASWHSPALDRTMPELSVVASKSRLWIAIAALLAIFGGEKGRWTAVEGMVAIGVNSFMANVVFKRLVRRQRPIDSVPEERRLVQPESSSFPSGHSASAAAFSGIVDRAYPKLWLPMNGLAVTVAFSRVYTGVHYPGDVLGGWLLGKSVAFMVSHGAKRMGYAPDDAG